MTLFKKIHTMISLSLKMHVNTSVQSELKLYKGINKTSNICITAAVHNPIYI